MRIIEINHQGDVLRIPELVLGGLKRYFEFGIPTN